jgi:hypothetical protein
MPTPEFAIIKGRLTAECEWNPVQVVARFALELCRWVSDPTGPREKVRQAERERIPVPVPNKV